MVQWSPGGLLGNPSSGRYPGPTGGERNLSVTLWIRTLLAYTRAPGNAFSFWIRETLRWSRGRPELEQESKEELFAYLDGVPADDVPEVGTALLPEPEIPRTMASTQAGFVATSARRLTGPSPLRRAAEARALELHFRYDLEPLAAHSSAAVYRKNHYLLDVLDRAWEGLEIRADAARSNAAGPLKALDVGCQDWHYVFGLERWLRRMGNSVAKPEAEWPVLEGIELDGFGIYPDLRSRRDYAEAYIAQTGNSKVTYATGDFLAYGEGDYDLVSFFYPFVLPRHLLLWGLPLRYFAPEKILSKSASLQKPGAAMMAWCHTEEEHECFIALAEASGAYRMLRQGPVVSRLVDFHADVSRRRFSIWRRNEALGGDPFAGGKFTM